MMAWIGPVMSGIGAISSLFGGGGASRRSQRLSNQAMANQNAMSQEQLNLFRNAQPFLGGSLATAGKLLPGMGANAQAGLDTAAQFDPAKQTEQIMRNYDTSQRNSLGRDLGTPIANAASMGFTKGTGDSDLGQNLANTEVSRQAARGSELAGLQQAEPGAKLQALGQAGANAQGTFQSIDPASAIFGRYGGAIGSLNGPSATQGEQGQFYGNQASQWDPTKSIGALGGALGGLFGPTGTWNNVANKWRGVAGGIGKVPWGA